MDYNINPYSNMTFTKYIYILILLTSSVLAESISSKEESLAKEAHIASINTLLIFTSHEGLNSGQYHFTDVGIDMEIYHLPLTYQFKSNKKINYFLVGSLGYSRVFISKEIDIPPSTGLDYNNHLRTYIAGIGGGARYRLTEDITISGGLEFLYSKSGVSVKSPDDDIGEAIQDLFKQNYNDNLSYKIFAKLDYIKDINEYKTYAKLSYKLYETKSSFTWDEAASFKSQSSVSSLVLGAQTPRVLEFDKNYVAIEGYINFNYLTGQVPDVVHFNAYGSVGVVSYLYTPDEDLWISRYFLEVSTVHSSGLSGYNVGVGFTIDLE